MSVENRAGNDALAVLHERLDRLLVPANMSGKDFIDWVFENAGLAEFLAALEFEEETPQAKLEVKWMSQLEQELAAVVDRLKPASVPPRADLALRTGQVWVGDWPEIHSRLLDDLRRARLIVVEASTRLSKSTADSGPLANKGGRPKQALRNRVLAKTFEMLRDARGMRVEEARRLTGEAIQALGLGIAIPGDDRALERAIEDGKN